MPMTGIEQPELLRIGADLRLRKYDGRPETGFAWYQDPELTLLVDGKAEPYPMERVQRMYEYLDSHGELYWIELLRDGAFRPIGDVTFWQEDMPIVIGDKTCRGRHVGRRVVRALAERGWALGFDHLEVQEIFTGNEASRRCFEAVGFRAVERTAQGWRYRLRRNDHVRTSQVLLIAFSGTSAEDLIRGTEQHETLFLPSDRVQDSKMLISAIDRLKVHYIFAFGQKPNIKDKVYIETTAREGEKEIRTAGDHDSLKSLLEKHGVTACLSDHAGASFCNSLYWNGLNHIATQEITAEMIFLHIPFSENVSAFETFRKGVLGALDDYIHQQETGGSK